MISKKAKKYPYQSEKEEEAIPEEDLPEDPFVSVATVVDEIDDVDADDDEISDGVEDEEESDEEREMRTHGFHLVTGEEDDDSM